MASIKSEKHIVTSITPDEGMTVTVDYPNAPTPEKPYWHVLSGWDTEVTGTPEEPSHLLGVVSESMYAILPEEYIPEGMSVVATFDHDPSREELDQFIPDTHKDNLKGEK